MSASGTSCRFRMSALRSLTGVKRTRYAQGEFFAFCPEGDIGLIEIPHCGEPLT
jgi:uncharacterized protein YbbK (DUF523 family)